jgi:hypothetical protein
MKILSIGMLRPGMSPRLRAAAGCPLVTWTLLILCPACAWGAGPTDPSGGEAQEAFVKSEYLKAGLSGNREALLFVGVDSLGRGKVEQNVLLAQEPAAYANPGWRVEAGERELRFRSTGSRVQRPGPFVITIDTRVCYGTLLGVFNQAGAIALPAVLHLPGYGTLRVISAAAGGAVGYTSGPGWIKVSLPGAADPGAAAEYRMEVTTVCPPVAGAEHDPRYDGFRRNWLNVLQLNPNRRVLSNNTNSDTCGFCYYEYADIARRTPPLADGLHALDIVRQSLESVLGGMKAYGMPGYGAPGDGGFREDSADTSPSLLIAADDYVEGRPDWPWLRAHYPGLRAMADKMLATDRNGDGLIKYAETGNSGSWNEGMPKVRPSNWWDTIGFGYEDAYANALAYRALLGMQRMADAARFPVDAARYGAAAGKLHDAYFRTFLDPETGVLAGWRSADGYLHDYYFTFVNSAAVLYGLVPADKEAGIMDRLWDKMVQVGYTRFGMGLPGNLVPVPRRDYAHKEPRWGGGAREDNADGFQIYENGGATACFSYFTIAAFNRVGQRARSDRILFPLLGAFENREFEGTGAEQRTNDWRKWDGTAEGYEGFLVDNYYALLAVPERR